MKEKERMSNKNNMTLRLEKMTQESICKSQISRGKLSKKRSLQEKGITLIALVVTIIILLILAGVTLNIALSDNGLFSKTKEATEKYKQEQSDEEEMVRQIATQMYSEYVGAEVTGYDLTANTNSTCKVTIDETGYTTEQTINRDSNMAWKIWDFDGNTLRIIGNPTGELFLQGATGYNNGVGTLEHICKELYENGKDGVNATNLKRTDIQKVSTYDYTKYKHGTNDVTEIPDGLENDTIRFGEAKPFDDAYYPEMWDENDRNWTYEWNDSGVITGKDKECTLWEKTESKDEKMENEMQGGNSQEVFKQSYYSHVYQKDEFINDKYYDLIFKKDDEHFIGDYWLAGREIQVRNTLCCFGLCAIRFNQNNSRIGSQDLCYTNGRPTGEKFAIRPIVSINLKDSGCTMTKEISADEKVTYKLNWAQS